MPTCPSTHCLEKSLVRLNRWVRSCLEVKPSGQQISRNKAGDQWIKLTALDHIRSRSRLKMTHWKRILVQSLEYERIIKNLNNLLVNRFWETSPNGKTKQKPQVVIYLESKENITYVQFSWTTSWHLVEGLIILIVARELVWNASMTEVWLCG